MQYRNDVEVWRRSIDALEPLEPLSLAEEPRKLFVALCSNAAQALLKCPEVEKAATELAAAMADKARSSFSSFFHPFSLIFSHFRFISLHFHLISWC